MPKQASPDAKPESPAREGERLIEAGDLPGAIEAFTKAIRRRGSAELYLARGRAHEAVGEAKAALADYSKAVEAAPRDVESRLARARLASELGQTDTVISDCAEVLRASPADAEALKLRGDAYRRAG